MRPRPVLDSPVARCQLGGVWSPWPCTRPQHRWARSWTSIACRSPLDNAPGAPPRRFGGFLRICIVPATLRYTPVCYHGSPWCARGSLACSRGRSLPGMAPRGGVGGAVTHAPVAAREVVAVARAALVDHGAAGRTVDTQAGGHGQRCWRMRMVLARTWTRSSPGASGRREAWIPPTVVYGRRWAHLGWARGLGRGGCSSASRRQPRAGRAHARAPPPSRRPAAALWTRPTSTRMVVALWRGEGAGPLVLRRVPPSRPPAVRCAWLWLPTASPINTARTVDRAVNTETKARGGDWAIPRGWGVPAPTGASRGMAGVEYHTRGAQLYAWAVGGAAMAAVLPHRARAPRSGQPMAPEARGRGQRVGHAQAWRPPPWPWGRDTRRTALDPRPCQELHAGRLDRRVRQGGKRLAAHPAARRSTGGGSAARGRTTGGRYRPPDGAAPRRASGRQYPAAAGGAAPRRETAHGPRVVHRLRRCDPCGCGRT